MKYKFNIMKGNDICGFEEINTFCCNPHNNNPYCTFTANDTVFDEYNYYIRTKKGKKCKFINNANKLKNWNKKHNLLLRIAGV